MKKVLQLFLHRRFIKHLYKEIKTKANLLSIQWMYCKVLNTAMRLYKGYMFKTAVLPWITAVHLLGASSLTWPPTGKLRRRFTLTSDPGATLMVSFFSGSFPGFKMSDNFIVRLSTVSLGKITGSCSKKKS